MPHWLTFNQWMTVFIGLIMVVIIIRVGRAVARRKDRHDAEAESFAGDMRMSDDEYVDAITGDQPAYREPEAFSYDGLYRGAGKDRLGRPLRTDIPLPEHPVTGTLNALPDPVITGPVAKVIERDDYITGRAVRIIRRAEEERTEWHWDELLGEWKPPVSKVTELPWDDWLRQLLLNENAEVAA